MRRRTNLHLWDKWLRCMRAWYFLLGIVGGLLVLMKLHSLIMPDSTDLEEYTLKNFEFWNNSNSTKSKVAFMFIARQRMPLDVLWEHFFDGSEEHEYSVYIHASPGFSYTERNTVCRSFINRQLPNSVVVEWGRPTMIQAERLLLREALQDPLNERFILLSDSCIPLYNFRYVYDYVMTSQKSFVDSFYEDKFSQYNIPMAPTIPEVKWRKGSQWFALTKKHASIVAADSAVYSTFVDHCKCLYCRFDSTWSAASLAGWLLKVVASRSLEDDSLSSQPSNTHHNCIPDEHYIPTLLAIKDTEDEIERHTLTYSRWETSADGRPGWHPATFASSDTLLQTIEEIQGVANVRFDTEGRTEWCSVAGQPRRCFLFARKFSREAAFQLIDEVERYENRT